MSMAIQVKHPLPYRRLVAACGIVTMMVVAGLVVWWRAGLDETKEPPLTSVEFQLDWIIGSYYAPYVLADKLGFYKEEGLSVHFIQGKGADTTAKLISQGLYGMGTGNAAQTAIAVAQGLDVVSIAMIDKEAVTSIFSLQSENIVAPGDLRGKTLGVRYYDVSHSEYLAMMHANGISPREIKEVGVGFDLQPLVSGQVDAMYNYSYNMPVRLQSLGYRINQIRVRDWGVKGYGANIIANPHFLDANGDIVQRFLRATRRAWQSAAADPEAAIDALVGAYPEIERETALQSLKAELVLVGSGNDITLCQSPMTWDEAIKTYESVGLINTHVTPKAVYTNVYLDGCE